MCEAEDPFAAEIGAGQSPASVGDDDFCDSEDERTLRSPAVAHHQAAADRSDGSISPLRLSPRAEPERARAEHAQGSALPGVVAARPLGATALPETLRAITPAALESKREALVWG